MSDQSPPASNYVPPMSREKAIEILSESRWGGRTTFDREWDEALTMGIAALIAEKLHLDGV